MTPPQRIAVCIKQIPAFAAMELGADGRLARTGVPLEMNAYCRRAVATAATLAADGAGHVTVLTMGPPTAADALREALAWCDAHNAPATGVALSDDAFAGSDTLATSRALAAALTQLGPFDLVLLGRNAVDADTGQVGPELAEMLGLPLLSGVRAFHLDADGMHAECEYDDALVNAHASLPLVVTCAERLCEPAKVDPEGRALVDATRITIMTAAMLGPGPWGAAGSPTWVGPTRTIAATRRQVVAADVPLDTQVAQALALLDELGAFDKSDRTVDHPPVPPSANPTLHTNCIAVICEPDHNAVTRELLGEAATLAQSIDAHVVAFAASDDAAELGAWGADVVHAWPGAPVAEDCAHAISQWCATEQPWAVLVPSTVWGREVAGRIGARLGLGLTGDAVALEVEGDRLIAWKPAFGGQLVAAIATKSAIQMATVRSGVFALRSPRAGDAALAPFAVPATSRTTITAITRTDDATQLADADVVIGVGGGVHPDAYGALDGLCTALGATLGASRKVTDNGWLPRARQIGITGRAIAPRCYVAIGISGKFNHMVGVRAARAVLAINSDPDAPVFEFADAGIVAPWETAVPAIVAALHARNDAAAH